MQITFFGFIWFVFCIISVFRHIKYSVFLVFLSCIFQATAVIIIGKKGISPLFISEFFLIVHSIRYIHITAIFRTPWIKQATYLLLYVMCISIIGPLLFEGVKVYPGALGIDDSFALGGVRLEFSQSNIVQIIYLIVNILALIMVEQISFKVSQKWVINSFVVTGFAFIILGTVLYIERLMSLNYVTNILYSNIGFSLNYDSTVLDKYRFISTFSEASTAGGYISAMIAFCVFSLKKQTSIVYIVLLCLYIIALVLNRSSTSLVSFVVLVLYYIKFLNKKTFFLMFISLGILFFVVSYLNYWETINELIFSKMDSQSGQARRGADERSLNIFFETYGLGVGLGSHRTSSFIFNLLSCTGIFGILNLGLLLNQIMFKQTNFNKEKLFIANVFLGFILVSQVLSIPDFSYPPLWLGLFYVVYTKKKQNILKSEIIP